MAEPIHPKRLQFPKRLRILKSADFERVMQGRVSLADATMRVYATTNDLGHPRLGLVVSRRIGGATTRNVWKRAIREAFRLTQHELPACDLVCIPHRDLTPDVRRLLESLPKIALRLEAELRRRLEAERRRH